MPRTVTFELLSSGEPAEAMTAGELAALLAELPPDMPVVCTDGQGMSAAVSGLHLRLEGGQIVADVTWLGAVGTFKADRMEFATYDAAHPTLQLLEAIQARQLRLSGKP